MRIRTFEEGWNVCHQIVQESGYSAYLWVVKQFFRAVQTVKPAASRSQLAQIFLVCEGYIAPDKIGPHMFDPRCVFKRIDGHATGGGDKNQMGEKADAENILHKESGKRVRSRNRYNMPLLELHRTLRATERAGWIPMPMMNRFSTK